MKRAVLKFNPSIELQEVKMNNLVLFSFVVGTIVAVSAQLDGLKHHYQLQDYIDYRAKPKYHYDYAVQDLHNHDVKSHWEQRDDKGTKGVYSLLQPDGRKRIVEYTADKHGVNYKVRYEEHSPYGRINTPSKFYEY